MVSWQIKVVLFTVSENTREGDWNVIKLSKSIIFKVTPFKCNVDYIIKCNEGYSVICKCNVGYSLKCKCTACYNENWKCNIGYSVKCKCNVG